MGWQDDFRRLDGILRSGYQASTGLRTQTYRTFDDRMRDFGLGTQRPAFGARPSGSQVRWSDLAAGRAGTSTTRPKPTYSPAERINVALPYSSTRPGSPYGPPVAPPRSTKGDILGSAEGAVGALGQNLTLSNFIPWLMERGNVLAEDLANADIPGISQAAGLAAPVLGTFLDGVAAASQVVAPIMDGLPSWQRDSILGDRAKLYRAMTNGEVPDYGPLNLFGGMASPFATAGEIGSMAAFPISTGVKIASGEPTNVFAPLTGETTVSLRNRAAYWQHELLNAVDPQRRLDAQTRLAILRDSIDLPLSVKANLDRKPQASDDELERWLDEGGRAWSYEPGPAGVFQNMGPPLLWYLAEARAGGLAARGLTALSAEAGLPALTRATAAVGGSASLALRIQTAAAATGVGIAGVTTVMNAIARYAGDEAAVRWWDNALRTTEFSDDPKVQLATGFMVNPFKVANQAVLGRGTVVLRGGARAVIGKVAGRRMLRLYNSETVINDMARQMFKRGSSKEAAEFMAEQGIREIVPDMILQQAADLVLARLPQETRMAFNARFVGRPVEHTIAALETWHDEILDLIAKEPKQVAARFTDYDWPYRMSVLPFEAEAAAKIARLYRLNTERSFDLRAAEGLVVGYRDYLAPQGQSLARAVVDEITDASGAVPMRAFTDLVVDLPVLAKHIGGLVRSDMTSIPRATVDRIIDAAVADWERAAKLNPIRVATGADPVLRPSSPTLVRDMADALGTDIETVTALTEKLDPGDATAVDLARRFLVEKASMESQAAAALTPEDALSRALARFDELTAPWWEHGRQIEAAERQIDGLTGELVRLRRGERGPDVLRRTELVERQIAELRSLIGTASDPIQTYAARIPGSQVEASFKRAVAKLDEAVLAGSGKASDAMRGRLHDLLATTVGGSRLLDRPLADQLAFLRAQAAEAGGRLGNRHLAELAARKVDAIERLRALADVDEGLRTAGLEPTDLDLVVTTADGELGWADEVLGGPPAQLRDAIATFRLRNAPRGRFATRRTGRLTGGEVGAKEQVYVPSSTERALAEIDQWSPELVWAEAARSPRFVPWLRTQGDTVFGEVRDFGPDNIPGAGRVTTAGMTGNQIADLVEGASLARRSYGHKIETVADALGMDRETALKHLASLRTAREKALDGRGPEAISRAAKLKVRDEYVRQAEVDRVAREVTYDAEFDAFAHPRNVAKVIEITDRADELWPGLREVVAGDGVLEEGIARVAAAGGRTVDQVLDDPSFAPAIRKELVPDGFEPPTEGLVRPLTSADTAIIEGDRDALVELAAAAAEQRTVPRPPVRASLETARRVASPTASRSYRYRRELSDLGARFEAPPAAHVLADPRNAIGLDALSYLNHGILGTKPATIGGVIALLRDIEAGNATKAGLGRELQAEAQRVARAILDDATRAAKRDPENLGIAGAGFFPEDEMALAATLEPLIRLDPADIDAGDPLAHLTYGLKRPPKGAVVLEWSRVPGLAEEMLAGRFRPFEERLWTTQAKAAVGWLFGRHSNQQVAANTKAIFIERAARRGVTAQTATAMWDDWMKESRKSRTPSIRRRPGGAFEIHAGDTPLYAGIANLPNDRLLAYALGSNELGIEGTLSRLKLSEAEAAVVRSTDWSTVLRESTSFTRRHLADSRIPLGKALAGAYGMAAHNKFATTGYYWFRFGLDMRYHAMNWLEAQILYLGRAGFRRGEIDRGLFGMNEGYLRNLDSDPVSNTGYPIARDRMAWAYRTVLKEQPDAVRNGLRDLHGEMGQEAMDKAMQQLARSDPQLRDMIEAMGDTPERFLTELDGWHAKMLANVDELDDAKVIDEALAEAMRETPELNAVFSRISQVNKDLWSDIRGTFYGNPNRSRVERFLNQWLLFWPISYQIKSTKWFARVLFDRAGGIQTNALGAVTLDQMATTHNRLLAEDPEYRDWFEKHRTLVFVAQMMFPVSFDSMGVSLNPFLRGVFFERDPLRALNIGPIYTYNEVIRPLWEEAQADLYPTFGDFMGDYEPPKS